MLRPATSTSRQRSALVRATTLTLLAAITAACASTSAPAPASGPSGTLRDVRGFDGGSQIRGGFTGVASATVDSVIPEPRGRVWRVLPDVFRSLGVATPTVDPGSYTIGNPGSRISRIEGSPRLSQYLDCGIGILGPNADRYEVTLQLLVQLGLHDSGGTVVRTTLDAYARPRSQAADPIHCASQRTLERRVVALISEELRPQPVGEGARALILPSTLSAGRIPRTGDLLRVECLPRLAGVSQRGVGRYVGAGDGLLQLEVDSRGRTVAIPAVHVTSVQIRERRSYAFWGGLFGAVLGAAGGAYYGANRWYDPDSRNLHYGRGTFTVIGGVAGVVGGFLAGRIAGSLFRFETWHDAPTEWALRTSGAQALDGPAATGPGACPVLDDE